VRILSPSLIRPPSNLKTAKALGIALPQSLLSSADEVIRYTDPCRDYAERIGKAGTPF
jgi:hypothetical protein